jgi:hypothetical protein
MSTNNSPALKRVILSFTAPIEFGPYLQRIAKRRGLSQSQFICQLAEAYMAREKVKGPAALVRIKK